MAHKIINWPIDPFALGAYSYDTIETKSARAELLKSEDGVVFFAGEALYDGKDTATVEGALASGLAAAKRIAN